LTKITNTFINFFVNAATVYYIYDKNRASDTQTQTSFVICPMLQYIADNESEVLGLSLGIIKADWKK